MVKISNIKHRLYMPPLKKYEVYGKFPWKLIIQVLLVLFTSIQIIYIVNRSTTYAYNQYTLWNKVFLNKDVQGSDITITNSYNLFSCKSLTKFVQDTVNNYYDINSQTIDDYKYLYKDNGEKKPPKLMVDYYNNDKALDLGYEFVYDLYSNDLGPFSSNDLQDYLHQVKKFEIRFNLIHSIDKYVNLASDCYEWELIQVYDYSYHGVVEAKLNTKRFNCGGYKRSLVRNFVWVDAIVITLAAGSILTIINYFRKRVEILEAIRGVTSGSIRAWERLGFKEKLKLFNFWTIIAIFGNLFQIFGAVLSIFEPNSEFTITEILIGFGCFFAWIGVIRFISKSSHSYTIVQTVTRAFPIIGMYIFGVVPIFMAYTFLAMCLFWQTGIYPTTPMSMIANFAVVNGDSVDLFGMAEYQEHLFMGQLYYYTFVVFFICCVHNLFIAIIERSFSSIRTDPIDYHEDSDEEEKEESPKKKKIEEDQWKKRQSILAFKKILNVGRGGSSTVYDEETLKQIQTMDKIVDEVLDKLQSLYKQLLNFEGDEEFIVVMEHFKKLLDEQFYPVVDHFN